MSPALQLQHLDADHLGFAADLHASALPPGLFTALGPRWLQAYYRTFVDSPYGVTLLATLEGRPVGMLAGTTDTAAHRAWISRASRRRLIAIGLRAAARRPRVALLLARARGRRLGRRRPRGSPHQATATPTAVLAYLAVVPGARGLGVGAALVERFVGEAARAGAPEAMLVTLAGDAGAGRFYKRLGWRYVGDQYNQEGHLVSRYRRELPQV
jgi:ribosomal protein S18 acetylase RimI-like enzyme